MDCSRVLAELVGKYVMYAWAKLYDNRLIKEHGLRFVPAVFGIGRYALYARYLPYSDYLLICDTSTYIYRVGYSMATLSTCIKDFRSEYAAFPTIWKEYADIRKPIGWRIPLWSGYGIQLTVFFIKSCWQSIRKRIIIAEKSGLFFCVSYFHPTGGG